MLSTLLVSYYLQQFRYPAGEAYRPSRTAEHIRTVEQRGRLTVESSSVEAGTVPPGAQRVEMLQLRLSADCTGNVPIDTITVQRRGLGFGSDIKAVYAMHRGQRISTARAIEQGDGLVDLTVRDFTVTRCTAEDVAIYADFAVDASAAGEHTFELKGIDAGKSTVRIEERSGNFLRPIRTVSGRVIGTLSVEYLDLTERVRFGERQTVARFTLTADNYDDQLVSAITFTNQGSASNADLENLYVDFRNRIKSLVAPSMRGDAVRIVFDPPLMIRKNQTLKFGLRADVRASRSRTIQFIVEEEGDIEAVPAIGRPR